MKEFMSSLDLFHIVRELDNQLINSWIVNIYQFTPSFYTIKLRKMGAGTFTLLVETNKRVHVSTFFRESPTSPPPRIQTLRKHLRKQPIRKVYQRDFDRILVLEVGMDPEKPYKLIVEMFGQGNLVLVSPEGKIIYSDLHRKMKDRDLHAGRVYQYPPQQEKHLRIYSTKEMMDDFLEDKSNKKITLLRYLNRYLGAGKQVSSEIITRAELGLKLKITELTEEQEELLKNKIIEFNLEVEAAEEGTSFIILDDEKQEVDVIPFTFQLYADHEKVKYTTFNEAVDNYFSSIESLPTLSVEKQETVSKEVLKLRRRLQEQEEHLQLLKDDTRSLQFEADVLNNWYTEVNEILETLKSARQNGFTWDQIKEKIDVGKQQKLSTVGIIEGIFPDVGELHLFLQIPPEMQEAENDSDLNENSNGKKESLRVVLDIRKNFFESTEDRFAKSKRFRAKQKGAKQAILKTLELLQEAEANQDRIEETRTIESNIKIKKRKKRWYERFRWFYTSTSDLVIAGRDAKSNQQIIRNFFQDGDIFFHADTHGAPSVVLKSSEREEEVDMDMALKEAAQFSVCFSSLWKQNAKTGDAYYVDSDQVSLSAPSGEFIPTGGVMIRGKRSYVRTMPLELIISVIFYPFNAQVVIVPESSIGNYGPRVAIRQGDISSGKLAKEIQYQLIKQTDIPEEKAKIAAIDLNEFVQNIPGSAMIDITRTEELIREQKKEMLV